MQNNLQIPDKTRRTAFGTAFQSERQESRQSIKREGRSLLTERAADNRLYEYYGSEDPKRGARFGKHMAGSLDNATYGVPVELVFSFEKLKPDATVVDVGGGIGQNSIRLAKHFPSMSFIVQDKYSNADSKWSHLPSSVRDRMTYQAQDFLAPEPVKGADLYLISQILMDHPPSACQEMLGHILEAMTPNHSILLISDFMSPGSEEGNFSLMTNALNLHMMAILGRAFWTRQEWEDLFASVSPLLKLQSLDFSGGRAIFELVKQPAELLANGH